MPAPSVGRQLRSFALWPFGISLTSWNYLWRTTPMRRAERVEPLEANEPPPLPPPTGPVQALEDGFGDLFHRSYRVRIQGARRDAATLMARIKADLNCAAPTEFARFLRDDGHRGSMQVGDEYLVHMPGPWNGPVRVVEATESSFRLVTLPGHLEAGQIEFRAVDGETLAFEIESWARSGDRLSKLLYQHARMAKEVQMHMWVSFLEQVVKLAGGKRCGPLEIDTRRVRW